MRDDIDTVEAAFFALDDIADASADVARLARLAQDLLAAALDALPRKMVVRQQPEPVPQI